MPIVVLIMDKPNYLDFVVARGEGSIIKDSGRSTPGLLIRFGEHVIAADVTVNAENFEKFKSLFGQLVGELLAPADLTRTLETARLMENEIWGQDFPAPLFMDEFDVEQQRVLKDKHLKLRLRKGETRIDAIRFNFST